MNGEFEVTSVSHTFCKEDGFLSVTGWIKKVTISPGDLPLVEARLDEIMEWG